MITEPIVFEYELMKARNTDDPSTNLQTRPT